MNSPAKNELHESILEKLKAGKELTLYEFVLACLLTRGETTVREVAEGVGMSMRTLEKILSGEIQDPGVSHCEKIAAYFRARGLDSNATVRA